MLFSSSTVFVPAQLMLLVASRSSTFVFPKIPLHFGIRHIHSPEHLVAAHPLTFPYFKILPNVSQPVVHQDCALVSFDFEVGFVPRRFSARMFSSDCMRSSLLIMDENFRSCAYVSLAVMPHGAGGHSLSVDITPYMQVSRLAVIGARFWQHMYQWESCAFWGCQSGPISENLRKYRLCVMHPETRK
jgi:hypothetical protein